MENLKARSIRIVLGGLIVLISYYGLFFLINLLPTKKTHHSNEGETRFVRLAEMPTISSDFLVIDDNLNRIDILFKNPNLESRDAIKVTLSGINGKMIYSQTFSGFNFGDTSRARLDFNEIVDSKGSKLNIKIEVVEIIDGKLMVGYKGEKLDTIMHYGVGGNWQYANQKAKDLLMNPVLILPFLSLILLVW